MNVELFYTREAANDSHISDIDFQSTLHLSSQVDAKSIKFLDILNIAIQKEERKEKLGEITSQTLNMFYSRVNSNVLEFFGKFNLKDINSKELLNFIEFLDGKSIKPVTIKQYLGLVKRILSIAVLEGFIDALPVFPKVKGKSIPRASLSIEEYSTILRCAKRLSKPKARDTSVAHGNTVNGLYTKDAPIPEEMVSLIRFMTNTFLRPVDIKILQHKHIKIIDGKNYYLKLSLPETKSHTGQIISLRAAVRVYRKLMGLQTKNGFGAPNDYVFLPQIENREVAIQAMSYMFGKVLRASNLHVNGDGQKRSLYSLRHTAITFRLIYGQGIDLLTLARNARTSVEMIEKFYSSNLQAEMNVNILQSKRTRFG